MYSFQGMQLEYSALISFFIIKFRCASNSKQCPRTLYWPSLPLLRRRSAPNDNVRFGQQTYCERMARGTFVVALMRSCIKQEICGLRGVYIIAHSVDLWDASLNRTRVKFSG